jgi:hypothetical protein
MATALLIIAALVDLALAALLVAVSGFVVGGGPQGMNANGFAAAAYWAAVVVCIAAAFAGFVLNRKGKTRAALILAWVPPAGALVAALLPPPY